MDIERSTRLLQPFGDVLGNVVRDHRRLREHLGVPCCVAPGRTAGATASETEYVLGEAEKALVTRSV